MPCSDYRHFVLGLSLPENPSSLKQRVEFEERLRVMLYSVIDNFNPQTNDDWHEFSLLDLTLQAIGCLALFYETKGFFIWKH